MCPMIGHGVGGGVCSGRSDSGVVQGQRRRGGVGAMFHSLSAHKITQNKSCNYPRKYGFIRGNTQQNKRTPAQTSVRAELERGGAARSAATPSATTHGGHSS